MQAAFFMTANAGTAPNLHFTEAIKDVAQDQTSVFRSAGDVEGVINIKLFNEVSYVNNDTPSDGLKIKFSSGGNNSYDAKDAPKYGNLDENLGRTLANNILALESRYLPVAGETLPLFINQYRTENYVFDIEINNINEIEVFLRDNYLDEFTPLSNTGNQVSFNVNQNIEASMAPDRFEIVFAENSLGSENFNKNQLAIYPNPLKGNNLQIRLSNTSNEAQVEIYDMLGKQIYSVKKQPINGEVSLNNLELSNGIYILKVKTLEGKSFTKKIIKG